MPRRPVEPDQLARWIALLRNHNEAIAAMDLFTLPTLSLRVLYGLFIIDHGQRRIVHFNATYHPTAQWVIQQLRKALPFDTAPAHLNLRPRRDLQRRRRPLRPSAGSQPSPDCLS
jgi:hypothetical protein